MSTDYRVQLIRADHAPWEAALVDAIDGEVKGLGLHKSVQVVVGPSPPSGEPAVAVYLGSPMAATEPACVSAIERALGDALTVIPVVEDLAAYSSSTPQSLHPINGWEWSGPEPAARLARLLLEELGIEERQRSVFISHKRDDGLYAAEQLHEYLSHHGFDPFIDRFEVRTGTDVQRRIAEALEEQAFLLLLETPLAHTSDWVFDEVDYALTHTMGIHIVRWPGVANDVPGSARLSRQALDPTGLTTHMGYSALTEDTLEEVLCEVEAAHASALVRRRRQLLRNVEDAAEAKGLSCTPLPGWRLLVHGSGRSDVVAVAGRLPQVSDLYELDQTRGALGPAVTNAGAILVHSARRIDENRMALLAWSAAGRSMTLVPENAIGGYW